MTDERDEEFRIVFVDGQGNETGSQTIKLGPVVAEPDHESWDVAGAVRELCNGEDDLRFAVTALDRLDGWHHAFELMRDLSATGEVSQKRIESFFAVYGLDLRGSVKDDALLFDVMRRLLRPYEGDGLILYRGDTAANHARRTYGPSWTTGIETAKMFVGFHREQGSVLLETFAPAEAVISRRSPENDHLGEQEYFVDARLLNEVRRID
jgi:hypothetical protein